VLHTYVGVHSWQPPCRQKGFYLPR
jgi:hypothetical protein